MGVGSSLLPTEGLGGGTTEASSSCLGDSSAPSELVSSAVVVVASISMRVRVVKSLDTYRELELEELVLASL